MEHVKRARVTANLGSTNIDDSISRFAAG